MLKWLHNNKNKKHKIIRDLQSKGYNPDHIYPIGTQELKTENSIKKKNEIGVETLKKMGYNADYIYNVGYGENIPVVNSVELEEASVKNKKGSYVKK